MEPYVGFSQVGGPKVSLKVVEDELTGLPIDGVLGFLSRLSRELVLGEGLSDPRWQGVYLAYAIVDDFPVPLQKAAEMYAPGRVPYTGGRHILVHEQNLAWLSHMAIVHCRRGTETASLELDLQRRVCRLLLIANDLLNDATVADSDSWGSRSLVDRKAFVETAMRYWQFNHYFVNPQLIPLELVRTRILMTRYLPGYFPRANEDFLQATGGVSIEDYFRALGLIVWNLLVTDHGPLWMSVKNLTSSLEASQTALQTLVEPWMASPEKYVKAVGEWLDRRPAFPSSRAFDFTPLRRTPLVVAREGEAVCPVLPLLLARVNDGPYFMLAEYLSGTQLTRFQEAVGQAYQDYAHNAIRVIAERDADGPWEVLERPGPKGKELADSCIVRGDDAIVFEHKAGRPGTEYLRGGSGERLLGPGDSVLAELEAGKAVSLSQGKKSDKGLVTRGMWQQSMNIGAVLSWLEKHTGRKPKRVFAVITHLSPLQVNAVSRAIYLDPLIQKASLYSDDRFVGPQWLYIRELEWLAGLAERGELSLSALLAAKDLSDRDSAFDVFMAGKFGRLSVTKQLREDGLRLLDSAGQAFWPTKWGHASSRK